MDDKKEPVIVSAKNIWEAIIMIYGDDAFLNLITFCKTNKAGLKIALDQCFWYIPEYMNKPEIQKYLLLL